MSVSDAPSPLNDVLSEPRSTILIVDDVPNNIRILVQALKYEHVLRVATSGAEALRLAERCQPDLVLLDVMMPGMDGYEVCRRLKAHDQTRSIPVIFISGHGEEHQELKGLELGASDYIAKPFSIAIVKARIATQLALKRAHEALQQQSVTDALTGLANRRRFDEALCQFWSAELRRGGPLAVLLIDVDFFKPYNDNYGHQAGDECLRAIGAALRRGSLRSTDLIARYGGEEFVALLPNTPLAGAIEVAERLRLGVAALQLPHAFSAAGPVVSISIGVACAIPSANSRPEALLQLADERLYAAKHAGRNRYHAGTEV